MKAISFNAIFNKITSTIDGGWRVSFDVPASDSGSLLELAALREDNLKVVVMNSEMIATYHINVPAEEGEEHA